jgi:serine/threonine-protein kinase RsbW
MSALTDGMHRQAELVELRMDARPENLVLARLALAGVVARAPLGEDVVADLKLAVTEACTNAIEHAYAGDAGDNEVVVRFSLDEEVLAVQVQDWGSGFDADRHAPEDELRDHAGVGLMLIRSLTDELTIASAADGSTVTFVKRLS